MGPKSTPARSASGPPPSGLAALYERERQPMLRVAVLLVGSAHVAEEVVQDAFAAVDRRWDRLDQPGAYLRTTVVNGCREVLRHREVEQRYQSALVAPATDSVPTHLVELRESLASLTERQRLVVVLRYVVDLPDAEIAEMLGCRPTTVRSLARRALAVLRKELS